MDGRPGLARSRDCAAQCPTSSRFPRSFRAHGGHHVSEMIVERCRCGAAAVGASLLGQAPSEATLGTLRQAAIDKLRAWAARRHGRDPLPITINRRRVYSLPTRFGIMLALMLTAMLIAGLNYNSNLGLAFAFLMISIALVTMHHCNRNLLRLD